MVMLNHFPPPKDLIDFLDSFGETHTFGIIGPVNTHLHGTIQEHYQTLKTLNEQGNNIYFIPNKTNLIGAKVDDIESARAIFIDDDVPRALPKTSMFPLPPTAVVQTSAGKYHYYWHCYQADLEVWRETVKTLIHLYDGDKAIHNPNRLMRLPGFINQKSGTASTLVSVSKTKYSWEKIEETWSNVIAEQVVNQQAHETPSRSMDTMIAIIAAGKADSGLHATTRDYAYGQVLDGCKPATIKANLRNIMVNYDLTNPRMLENWNKIDALVDSQYKKHFEVKYEAVEIADKVRPLEWDWSELKSKPVPEACLPPTLLEAAKEIGEWTGAGQDPAILSAVFITSALLAKSVVIHEIGDDLTTHCQSGIVIVMDTGGRKSSIYKQMNKPFFEYEERQQEQWEKDRFNNGATVKLLKNRVLKQEKKAEKLEAASEIAAVANDIGHIEKQINDIQVKKPSLRCADVTEEKLIRKLDENRGCMSIISDDARQVIKNLKGRYSDKVSGESVYINALTGSEIIYERVGTDKEIHIQHPVLNALLFVQPDAALELKRSEMYVPSGLAARLPMYFYPVSGIDIINNTERRPVDHYKMQPYYQALNAICLQRHDTPLHIRLSANGMDVCRRIDKDLVQLLKNEWQGSYDKINKIVTLTIMYATVFAALDDPDFRIAFNRTESENDYLLPTKYLNMAFEFSKNLFTHAISSHANIEQESLPRKARALRSTILKWYDSGRVTEGFVLQGDFKNYITDSLRPCLNEVVDLLVDRGWLYLKRFAEPKRKINGGFPNKLVDTGDLVYHLNVEGIKAYKNNLSEEQLKNNKDLLRRF